MTKATQKGTGSSFKTFKKVLLRTKQYRLFIILSLLMATVTVASTLYVPILIGRAIDCCLGAGAVDFAKIGAILVKVAIVVAVTALSQWIMNICNNKITYHVTRDIRNEAIEKIERLPLKYLDKHSYGDVISRVIADVDQFADGLLMGFTQFFSGIMTICGNAYFYAVNKCYNNTDCCGDNACLISCCRIYCKKDL